jgi:hypothetical protein
MLCNGNGMAGCTTGCAIAFYFGFGLLPENLPDPIIISEIECPGIIYCDT